MSVDAMRATSAERQSSGVVKDVQKSAQAGIGRHFVPRSFDLEKGLFE